MHLLWPGRPGAVTVTRQPVGMPLQERLGDLFRDLYFVAPEPLSDCC